MEAQRRLPRRKSAVRNYLEYIGAGALVSAMLVGVIVYCGERTTVDNYLPNSAGSCDPNLGFRGLVGRGYGDIDNLHRVGIRNIRLYVNRPDLLVKAQDDVDAEKKIINDPSLNIQVLVRSNNGNGLNGSLVDTDPCTYNLYFNERIYNTRR